MESSAPQFADWLDREHILRTDGTAIFLTAKEAGVPAILRHHVERNRSLQQMVLLVHVDVLGIPHVGRDRRCEVSEAAPDIWRVNIDYGFADHIDVPRDLGMACADCDLPCDLTDATFYIGRETLLPAGTSELSVWRAALFGRMVRNAGRATGYFGIPTEKVVEIGMQIAL